MRRTDIIKDLPQHHRSGPMTEHTSIQCNDTPSAEPHPSGTPGFSD